MCEIVHLGGAELDADAEHDPQYYNVHDRQNRLGCPGSPVLHVDDLRGRAGDRFGCRRKMRVGFRIGRCAHITSE
jgi:hypothetical protein